jgi:superfamily II DNA or RNA helicase
VARGESWEVVRREQYDDCAVVTLRGTGDSNLGVTTSLLTPFDKLTAVADRPGIRIAGRRAVLARAARAAANAHGWHEPWTASHAQIDLLPWQLEPAVAAVSGTTRLLLADGVGLGKTIQAGLIIAELRARGLIARTLVLTPASLRQQWAAELGDRFALRAQILDHVALSQLTATLPPGVNPWAASELVVSSIDLVKRPETRAALDSVPIDLLVVDEAHHLKPGTDRAALVADLSARATWVVLATATPHSGDEHAYAFLRRLGALPGTTDPVIFRRTARDVGRAQRRRVRFRSVAAGARERSLLDRTVAYARTLWNAHQNDAHGALVASVICRRAVSSPGSLARTLARRRSLLVASAAPDEVPQPVLPWLEEERADDVEADALLASCRLPETAAEITWLDGLIALAGQIDAASAKFDAIERLLARTREPAVIFSEYRDTLLQLAKRIRGGWRLALIHGGLTPRERGESVRRFVSGDVRLLLATDVAGEGLNLQARCRLVINVELPWSPVRLEQRVGRVDRLGQARRVHAVHLFHSGSFEDRVLVRLQRRMQDAALDLGDAIAHERDVVLAVLAHRALALPDILPSAGPAGDGSLRLVRLRRRAATASRHATRARARKLEWPCVAPSRRPAKTMVLLFEIDVHASDGRLVARGLVPIGVRFERAQRVSRGAVRRLLRALASSPAIAAQVASVTAGCMQDTSVAVAGAVQLVEARLTQIVRAIDSQTPTAVQGSLFDRRVEQQARARAGARDELREHARQRLSRIEALKMLSAGTGARLIAAWPLSH